MFRKSMVGPRQRQGGYTLIEAGFAIVIATIIAGAGITVVSKRGDTLRVEKAQQEMKQWLEASMQYRRDTGAWPASTTVLTTGNYMPASAVAGPFGGNYSVAPVSGNARLRVSYTATETRFANLISASLPLASVSGNTVNGEVVVPGAESSHDALLPRDGSRAMTGNLNMGGNSITGAANISATGYIYTPSYMQADLFYDAYNSGYYVRPRSVSRMNEVHADRVYGFADIRSPIFYDYNNTGYYVDPSYYSYMNGMYAAIIYDHNTNYFLDADATSRMNRVEVYGGLYDYAKGVSNDQAVHTVQSLNHGDWIAKPACYSGHSPRIYTAVQNAAVGAYSDALGGIQTYAADLYNGYWQVYMHIYRAGSGTPVGPSGGYGKILAFTKCE